MLAMRVHALPSVLRPMTGPLIAGGSASRKATRFVGTLTPVRMESAKVSSIHTSAIHITAMPRKDEDSTVSNSQMGNQIQAKAQVPWESMRTLQTVEREERKLEKSKGTFRGQHHGPLRLPSRLHLASKSDNNSNPKHDKEPTLRRSQAKRGEVCCNANDKKRESSPCACTP